MVSRIEQLQTVAEKMRDIEAQLTAIHETLRGLWQTILMQEPKAPS